MKLRYEPSTQTIRTIPENYMAVNLADMDAAVDRKEIGLLIAAAPELLKSLEKLLQHIEEEGHECEFIHNPESGVCEWHEMVGYIRALIAKAKGEAP